MDVSTQSFPVLSAAKVKRPSEADRRLPSWLAHPTRFSAVNPANSKVDWDDFAQFIDEDLRRCLKKNLTIDKMFPVQRALIPSLTRQFRSRHYRRPNDICVSSPTGSGKTLAFVIPIVNHLKHSITRSLRALIILPTKDLAIQVQKVFRDVSVLTNLKCETLVGDASECQKIFHRAKDGTTLSGSDHVKSNSDACSILSERLAHDDLQDEYFPNVDILVSTPGHIVDLIHNYPSSCFKDLEILVIDEADRMMANHKHDWLNVLERSLFPKVSECPCEEDEQSLNPIIKKKRTCYSSINACSIQHIQNTKPLHKLLFSATLSSDPQLLMHMNLYQPRLFIATKPSITAAKIRNSLGGSVNSTPCSSPLPSTPNATVNTRNELLTSATIPEQLEEKMFIIEAREKLFVMWYLFHELKYKNVICFTNQLPTSFRLCQFLNQIPSVRAVEFSSNMKPETRQKIVNEFKGGKIEVIVSTDLMARGMDLEGVEYVVSFDMPSSEIFYVHRVGRTARANNKGTAVTLVDTKQLVQFKRIVQLAHKLPNSMRLSDVVEEIKIPVNFKKSAEVMDLYGKTHGDYEDRLAMLAKKSKYGSKNK